MPALPERTLFAKLRAALPRDTEFETEPSNVRPAFVRIPGLGRVRIYLWTLTADRSVEGARPAGEHKIQLILPEQVRGTRGSLTLDGTHTAILGLSPEFGVFAGWDAKFYTNFGYSANVQIREETLIEARDSGWAVASPRRDDEVRVAFTPPNLATFLKASKSADRKHLTGIMREAYLLAAVPGVVAYTAKVTSRNAEKQIQFVRQKTTQMRLVRDWKFGAMIREQYGYSCAVCGIQLEIIEGAHIIPAHEPEGREEKWNGIALCPNHHSLFDNRTFVIPSDLRVHIDSDVVTFLRDNGRDEGLATLTDLNGRPIRRPNFYDQDRDLRSRMNAALDHRAETSLVA